MKTHSDRRAVEKAIALTGDEVRGLRNLFNMKDVMKRFVAGLIEEYLEGQAQRELEAWDALSQKFGFNNHEELEASGRAISLDFTARQVKLLKED